MMYINFNISSPWKQGQFKPICSKVFFVTEHKSIEIETYKYFDNLFSFELDLRWRGRDHAGLSFEINILGYNFKLSLVDSRHWDYVLNTWSKHD